MIGMSLRNTLRRTFQRIECAFVVFTWLVNGKHDSLITLDQGLNVHLWNEIQRRDRVVTGGIAAEESPFSFKSTPELSVGERVQHPNHRHRYRTFANEFDLAFKNVFRVIVKPNDEASHHFHPVTLNLSHRGQQVAAVLTLLRFLQNFFYWSSDTEKHPMETSLAHSR